MFGRSDDPIRDAQIRDEEEYEYLQTLPKCIYCDLPIQEEDCYEIDGELVCEECLVEHHRRKTNDYIGRRQ